MSFLDFVMFHVPYSEVLIRRLFYFFKDRHKNKADSNAYSKKGRNKSKIDKKKKGEFIDEFKKLEIKKGDLLIVHSSMNELSSLGFDAKEIILMLRCMVGEEGTLVYPAYPDYSKQHYEENGYYLYDVKKSISWTGFIPNLVCMQKKSIRSPFPNNPLVFDGPLADELTNDNLEAEYPHGDHSAWSNCVNRHAKIIFLGCNAMSSNTVQHVAEDRLNEEWPIDKWYEKKDYLIKKDGLCIKKTINERKPFWARFINEHRNYVRIKKDGFLQTKTICGVPLEFINDSYGLVEYLIKRARKGKLDYIVPKKYWKK